MKRGMNPGARTGVPGKLEHKVPKSFHIFRDMRYTYVSGSEREREREREREWESETMKALWLRVLLAFAFAGARLRGLGWRRVEFNFSAEEIPWEKRHGINTRLPPRSKESGPLENYLGHGLTSLSLSLSLFLGFWPSLNPRRKPGAARKDGKVFGRSANTPGAFV